MDLISTSCLNESGFDLFLYKMYTCVQLQYYSQILTASKAGVKP